ncbi:MAG: GNAT family N-acetyltransferase [Anaerolineae bacterium]|nr:GNAT family N-acetyltransferase [Anaerolineae bacterium]
MTKQNWEIRRLTPDDAPALAAFTQRQGWPHGEPEWRRLIDLGPSSCFCAARAGALVGTVTSVLYGQALAWIGMMLVDIDHRRKGVASALMETCLGHLRAERVQRVMLDASEMGRPLYERLGFRALHRVQRWEGPATEFFGRRFRRIEAADMGAVIGFDEARFGVSRGKVLLRLQAEFPRLGWIDRDAGGRVHGYILARRMGERVSIGPWLHDSPWGATILLNTALGAVRGQVVSLDLPDRNPAATSILADRALRVVRFNTRMIWGDAAPPQDEPAAIFGVAALALG